MATTVRKIWQFAWSLWTLFWTLAAIAITTSPAVAITNVETWAREFGFKSFADRLDGLRPVSAPSVPSAGPGRAADLESYWWRQPLFREIFWVCIAALVVGAVVLLASRRRRKMSDFI